MSPDTEPTVEAHYEQLLAPLYTWMLGGWPSALQAARSALRQLGVPPATQRRRALDLGCGHGAHVVALGELGYEVTAVDTSAPLLDELRRHAPEVRVVHDDIVRAVQAAAPGWDLVLCLGDTLPHLPSHAVARAFVGRCAALLGDGGRLAFGLRDHVSGIAAGTAAAHLVRADAQRLFTCCLDYRETTVRVTDLVHEAGRDGWAVRASRYDKLRLDPVQVAVWLREDGLEVHTGTLGGAMVSIVAARAGRDRR